MQTVECGMGRRAVVRIVQCGMVIMQGCGAQPFIIPIPHPTVLMRLKYCLKESKTPQMDDTEFYVLFNSISVISA